MWVVQADATDSDLSYTALQQQRHGYITNSMIIANLLHALYVLDFFVHEAWYLIQHPAPYRLLQLTH